MRNEDASQAGLNQSNTLDARDDADHLAAADYGPALGNTITGIGTITGAAGTDLVEGGAGRIVAVEGAGGSDTSFAAGKLEVEGQYGSLTIDADGNYSYARNPGTPAGVADVFNYTLQDQAGASDTAKLIINIGDVPMLQNAGNRVVPGADGVVVLPAGVELSDVRVVGRDLVITLPDGSTMVIVDGAVFVPQLVIDGVEVPATNLAALLIDSEPKPAAGDLSPLQQSSGGNFAVPVAPLDPGVPLGDLLPPTQLAYTPPEFDEIGEYFEENDPPVIFGASVAVSEEGLPGGLADDAPGPPQDTTNLSVVSGSIGVSDPNGDALTVTLAIPTEALSSGGQPISWALSNNGQLLTGTAGGNTVVTISINNSGAYTVTLLRQIDHPTGGGENTVSISVPVTVSDGELSAIGSLAIQFEDDSPIISRSSAAEPTLTVDETNLAVDASASLAGLFAGSFGADGAGTISYALGVTAGASGLTDVATGEAVNLVLNGGVVEGRTATSNLLVFTVSVNAAGTVTLDQLRALRHPDATNPDDPVTLSADSLVRLTATITDKDGDTASASVDIGQNLVFRDDGPDATVNGQFTKPVLVVDESPLPPNGDGDNSDTASFAGAFGAVVDYGTDGPGSVSYQLLLSGQGAASGLYALDAADVLGVGDDGDGIGQGAQILLYEIGGVIYGSTAANVGGVVPGNTYFTISADGSGNVTLTRSASLNLWNDNTSDHDDPEILTAAAGTIRLQQTVTDADGDSDTASIDLSTGVFRFEDDGPDATVNGQFTKPVLVVDESPLPPNGDGDNSDTASFAGAFGAVVDYGTDGPGSVSYQLLLSGQGAASGLYALDAADVLGVGDDGDGIGQGAQILLYEIGGVIYGSTAANVGGVVPGNTYFTISADGSGNVTLTRSASLNLWNDNTSDHDDPEILTAAAGTIRLQQTVTDADGDSDTASIDLSTGVFRFEDDGPDATVNGQFTKPVLVVDESPLPPNGDGDNSDTASFAGAFGAVVDYGTDGPGSVSYQLLLSGQGAASGLYALDAADVLGVGDDGDGIGQGAQILLYEIGGVIYGSTAANVGGVVPGNTYFTISADGSGNVTLTRSASLNLWNDNTSDHDDPEILTAAAGTIRLQQTVTDADGDSDTASIDLSTGVFRFEDDGPDATVNGQFTKPVLVVDESPLPPNGDGDNSDTASFAGAFGAVVDYGTDGPGSVSYQLLLSGQGAASGLYALDAADVLGVGDDGDGIGQGAQILLYEIGGVIYGSTAANVGGVVPGNTYFTISADGSGNVTLTRSASLNLWNDNTSDHDDPEILTAAAGTIRLQQTVTDADGDSDTASIDLSTGVFRFEDDGPDATVNGQFTKPVLVVDESPLPPNGDGDNSDTASFAGAFGAVVDYGTDGPGSVSYQLLLSGQGAASGLYALDAADVLGVGDDGDGIGQGAQILLYEIGGVIYGSTAANVGGVVPGNTYFTISADGSGNVTLTRSASLNLWNDNTSDHDDPEILTAAAGTIRLQQTVTDADGDSDTASIDLSTGVFRFEDDGPDATVNGQFTKPVLVVDESPLPPNGDGDNSDTASFAGAFGAVVDYGTDGPGSVSYQLLLSGQGAASGLYALDAADVLGVGDDGDGIGQGAQILLYEIGGVIYGSTAANVGGVVPGNTYFTISADGSGNVTLTRSASLNLWNDNTSDHDDPEILTAAAGTIRLQQTVTDADGDSDTASIDLSTGVFRFEDDGPDATVNGQFTKPVLVVDESPLPPNGDGDNSDTASFAGAFGAVVDYGTDGPGSVSYQLLLSGQGAASGLYALDAADVLGVGDDGDGIGQGAQILLYEIGGVIYGSTAANVGGVVPGNTYFTISADGSGNVTLTRSASLNLWNDNTSDHDDPEILTAAAGTIRLQQTVTDADGDSDTASIDLSTGVFRFEDDGPDAIQPDSAVLLNQIGASVTEDLDDDGEVIIDFGTDGPGLVRFANITNGENSGLTSDEDVITYWLSNNGQTLQARTNSTNGSDGELVFTVQINQATGDYTVTMFGTVDNGAGVSFDNLTSTKAGNVDVRGVGADDPATTVDLLLTASANGANATINTSSSTVGSANQSMDSGETIRIDFVSNLTANNALPSGFGYSGHVGTSSLLQLIPQVQGSQSATVAFRVYALNTTVTQAGSPDDTPEAGPTPFSDSTTVQITHVTVDGFDVGETPVTVALGGVGVWTTVAYGVSAQLQSDGSVIFTGIQEGDRYGIETGTDFNAVAVTALPTGTGPVGNLSTIDSFDLGVFAIGSVDTGEPVTINLDLSITDADGDSIVMPDAIDITFNPAPTPPVVLDMDGDGVEFLGLNAGVLYNYGAGPVATAWAGPDDAILVRDANGDGTVTDASEFVFGGNGVTDMEALHAMYGAQLDASDADFTMFALWTDANSNGVVDQGEMQSLAEAGIVSIGLVSDGQSYVAANGDVFVAGSSTYTRTDGSTGEAADAAFGTGLVARTQEVERIAANSNSVVVAAAVAAAGLAASSAAAESSNIVSADQMVHTALHSVEPLGMQELSASTSVEALATGFQDAAATLSLPLSGGSIDQAAWNSSIGDLGQPIGFDAAVSALGQGTDMIPMQVALPTVASDVAMPSAEALASLDRGPVQTIDTVEMILVDALQGGGANPIDAVLNGFGPGGIGGIAVIDTGASGFQAGVPGWDMGDVGAFTPTIATVITNEALMLHHDAIQPVANG